MNIFDVTKKLTLTLKVEDKDGEREYKATYGGVNNDIDRHNHFMTQCVTGVDYESELLKILHEEVIRQYVHGEEQHKFNVG